MSERRISPPAAAHTGPAQDDILDLKMLRSILDTIPILISVYEDTGKILYLNKAFEETLGWDLQKLNKEGMLEALIPDCKMRDEVLRYMQSYAREWRSFPIHTSEGRVSPSVWRNVRLTDCRGMGIGLDMTIHNSLEASLGAHHAQWLNKLFNLTQDGISLALVDTAKKTWKILECNRAYADLAGRTPDAIRACHNMWDLQIRSGESTWAMVDEHLKANTIFSNSFSWIRPDGSTTHIESLSVPLSFGTPALVATISREDTLRLAREQALAESEGYLRNVLKHFPCSLWATDKQGVCTLSEGHLLECLGLSPGQLVGTNLFEFNRDTPLFNGHLTRALEGESFLARNPFKDRMLETRFVPLADNLGEPMGAMGATWDITELELTRQALEENLALFRELAGNVSEGFIMFEASTSRILFLNDQCLEILGLPKGEYRFLPELIGNIHPEDRDISSDRICQSREGAIQPFDSYRVIHPALGLRHVEVHRRHVRGPLAAC